MALRLFKFAIYFIYLNKLHANHVIIYKTILKYLYYFIIYLFNFTAPTEAEIRGYAKDADASGTGMIAWPDFLRLAAYLVANPINKKERAMNAFKVFDSDKDGRVSAKELRHCLTTLGDKLPKEDVDEAFKEAGITDDTNLDLNAFLRLMGVN